MTLSGRVAIVTASAGAGIGQATVRALAKEGANVVVTDHHAGRTTSVAEDIRSTLGVKALGIPCDVTDRQQVESMVAKTLEEFSRIDILVNNAGIDHMGPVVDMTDESWELIININLRGTFYCTRAVLPAMIKQDSGRIINLASVAGWLHTAPDSAAYAATKAGIMGFTKMLAHEVAEHSITANAIAPGFILNPYIAKVSPPEFLEGFKKQVPLGRLGNPEDIANAIVFLATDEASYITGATLCVSGGWYMY